MDWVFVLGSLILVAQLHTAYQTSYIAYFAKIFKPRSFTDHQSAATAVCGSKYHVLSRDESELTVLKLWYCVSAAMSLIPTLSADMSISYRHMCCHMC